MKRRIVSVAVILGLLLGLMVVPAQAATEDEIEEAVKKGLEWLVGEQNPDGSWGSYERVAHTGLALIKLEERGWELRYEGGPFNDEYEYKSNVEAGLEYLMSNVQLINIAPQPAGDPDSNGNGLGAIITDASPTYATGIALMAIAVTRAPNRVVQVPGPVDGWTYRQVVQDAVDYLAFGQSEGGWPRGGWGYTHNMGWSDNSNSGYAVLGLDFSQAYGFNAMVPQFVKNELNIWIDYIQNDVDGDANDGGSGYQDPNNWVNILKTGNLIYQMAFFSDDANAQRVIDAVDYIERQWYAPGGCDIGWRDHRQAIYCMTKGLERMGIKMIDLDGDDVAEHDWFAEVAEHLLATQNADGSWPFDCWGGQILSTCWALLTLEDAFPPRVWCVEAVNPHGNNIPGGKANGKGQGVNPDGFYQLFAEDLRDPEPEIWVGAFGHGLLFGPFSSGVIIKFTEAPGAKPSMKKIGSTKGQADAVEWHITLPGEPFVLAVDKSNNWAWFPCFVPPPPK